MGEAIGGVLGAVTGGGGKGGGGGGNPISAIMEVISKVASSLTGA